MGLRSVSFAEWPFWSKVDFAMGLGRMKPRSPPSWRHARLTKECLIRWYEGEKNQLIQSAGDLIAPNPLYA